MKEQYDLLLVTLKNLAKPYDEQIKSYPEFVDVFDEVISDFNDAFQSLPDLIDDKLVIYGAVAEIIRCQIMIDLNLSFDDRMTDESFKSGEPWNLVRKHARLALDLLEN